MEIKNKRSLKVITSLVALALVGPVSLVDAIPAHAVEIKSATWVKPKILCASNPRYGAPTCNTASSPYQSIYLDWKSHWAKSYWRMTSGHNCTNYAAYSQYVRYSKGTRNSPPGGVHPGNANTWGSRLTAYKTSTPLAGDVAWWLTSPKSVWSSNSGHVAIIESVSADGNTIVISEDSWSKSHTDYFRVIRFHKSDKGGWPTAFLHFI